jgi:hypothetical protein
MALSITTDHSGIHPAIMMEFTRLLVNREMQLIAALDFDSSVPIPHDCSMRYLKNIITWHLSEDDPNSKPLLAELSHLCGIFLNDLERRPLFYSHSAEMLAIAAILMTFERLELPLQSPGGAPWFTFLAIIPGDSRELHALIAEVREFFQSVWKLGKIAPTERRKTAVTDAQMTH